MVEGCGGGLEELGAAEICGKWKRQKGRPLRYKMQSMK